MWTYEQRTGRLLHDGVLVGTGYSGHSEGKNNPAMQDQHNIGPIPQGVYTVTGAFTHPRKGPVCMRLLPKPGTQTFGRAGFLIHGDSIQFAGEASEGCIIQARAARDQVAQSPDKELTVVESAPGPELKPGQGPLT